MTISKRKTIGMENRLAVVDQRGDYKGKAEVSQGTPESLMWWKSQESEHVKICGGGGDS